MAEATHYVAVDVHKNDSQVAVLDDRGGVVEECRVDNENLEDIARKYEGSEAAIEATSNYFTIYDTLAEHLEVTLANPVKAQWLDGQSQKTDRVDAKQLARFLRLDEVPASYVPPAEIRRYRSLVRGRKKLVNKQTDFKNEVHAILDQNGVTYDGSLWSDEGRAFLEDLSLDEPAELLIEQWLTAIDEFEQKIHRLQRRIEQCANEVEAVQRLMTVPGIAAFSGLMIYAEIGEVDRFSRASELVSYAGLDPVVRASGETRTEGSISKDGNGYLRWILVQCASTAVFNAKDPYLHDFYYRLREGRNKPHKVAIVATARKLLVSVFHMLSKEEEYDPVM